MASRKVPALQSMQTLEPGVEVPVEQSWQVVWPPVAAIFPSSQSTHAAFDVAPFTPPRFPGAHSLQLALEAAPTAELKVPAPQARQCASSEERLLALSSPCFPAGQGSHSSAPEPLKRPVAQSPHSDAPAREVVPASHDVHSGGVRETS